MKVYGVASVSGRLQTLPAGTYRQAGFAVYAVLSRHMTNAKEHRVPVKTGVLRASGTVDAPEIRGSVISARGWFGGPSAPYAATVHENLSSHHPVGEAKYWENEINQIQGDEIAQEMRLGSI